MFSRNDRSGKPHRFRRLQKLAPKLRKNTRLAPSLPKGRKPLRTFANKQVQARRKRNSQPALSTHPPSGIAFSSSQARGTCHPVASAIHIKVCLQAKRLHALDFQIPASPRAILGCPSRAPNIFPAVTRPQNSHLTALSPVPAPVARRPQNSHLRAIWPLRRLFGCGVTLPKVVSPRNESGVRNRTELVRLKNSARSSSFIPSRTVKSLKNPMSVFLIPCPRALEEKRGAFPGTWSLGIPKQLPL